MTNIGKRLFAASAVVTFAVLSLTAGVRLSTADEPPVNLADLRDAVKAASKRGENVDEVARALDALDKTLAKGWKPAEGKKDPPAELVALRAAVEAAARKGENVDDIRKQLDAVETKLVGRALEAPKPVTPPLGDAKPQPAPRVRPRVGGDFPVVPRIEIPELPNRGAFGGIDRDALQKSMELRTKAMELLLKDPNDAEALKLMQQATEQMLKAIGGGAGGLELPDLMMELGGRVPDRPRLGVRMEKLTPVVVEQLGLEAGRGIAIAEVIAGSAAEKAGFKPHDIILEFAGKPVTDSPEDFNRQVTAVKAGEKVDAVVLRKGKKVELKGIELPEKPQPAPADRGRAPLKLQPLPELEMRPVFPNTLPDLDFKRGALLPAGGTFVAQSSQDGVKYTVRGTTENGEAKLAEVTIDDNGKVTKAESLEKVPEAYRAEVEKLLKNAAGRTVKPRVRD